MKRETLVRLAVGTVLMLGLFLNGCGGTSRSAKFYTLSPVQSTGMTGKQAPLSDTTSVTIGVGPVEIPDYLDRQQIVTRSAQNEIEVSEFDRWAGSLRDDVSRVLVENLSILLPPDKKVSVVPWNHGGPFQYRMAVHVARFDVTPGESVWLKARWTIFDRDGRTVVLSQESNLREPLNARDYPTMVAVMAKALGTFSRELADGINVALSAK